jgi:hypothetical protein
MSKDKSPEKKPVSLNEVWGQLDSDARGQIIDLFAHLVYQHEVSRHEESKTGDKDVSSRCENKDHAGSH